MFKFNLSQWAFIFIIFFVYLLLIYFLTSIYFLISVSDAGNLHKIAKISFYIQIIKENWSPFFIFKVIQYGYLIDFLIKFFIVFLVLTLILVLLIVALNNTSKNPLYGFSRWSNINEIKKGKLLSNKGVVVGLYNNKIMRFDSQEFVSLGAPTRSGKGTGIVIPNLIAWSDSIVVLDVKKECFDYTSKYRSEILNQKVFIFNPFSKETHRYNPLYYLDFNSQNIELQIQGLANSLYPTTGGGKDFFTLQAQTTFIAIVYLFGLLHNFGFIKKSYTLTTISDALNGVLLINDELISLEVIVEMMYLMELLPDTIYSRFISFFNQQAAKDQFAGVKSSFESPLNIFKDVLFENAMADNDFDFRQLRQEKISIYLAISPENLITAKPILNLFFNQLIFENIRQGLPDQNASLKHGVLLLMDEFTSIGYMQQYQVAVSFMAGYNIRSLIIYQNDAQLRENHPLGYGDKGAETLLENHTCNIIYRPKSPRTAEEISKRIGNITVKQSNRSISSQNVSRSESQVSRALILPQEIMDLKDNEEIILCNKLKVKANKANYFSTPFFINALKSISPTLKAVKKPMKKDYDLAIQRNELAIKVNFFESNSTQTFFKN